MSQHLAFYNDYRCHNTLPAHVITDGMNKMCRDRWADIAVYRDKTSVTFLTENNGKIIHGNLERPEQKRNLHL